MFQFNYLEGFLLSCVVIVVFSIVRVILKAIYTYAVGPVINKVDFKGKGKWALVTGCTDGIGKQYARELAARGCSIILVSRTMEKLKSVSDEIVKEYNVETKIVQADFTDPKIYDNIEKEIGDLEIGTLVNNVGITYSYPEYFVDIPDWDNLTSSIVNANIVSVTKMTKLVLPGMLNRRKGVIINLGSASSMIPSPLLTVYAASKAYVDKFSEGLQMEYSKKGIIVQCVLPGYVCSNMSGIRRSTFFAPTSSAFVKSAIGLVGTVTKTTGFFPHAIFVTILKTIKAIHSDFSVWLVTRNMETARSKILKKYKKQ